MVYIKYLLSPVKNKHGQRYWQNTTSTHGKPLIDYLPTNVTNLYTIVNGKFVEPSNYSTLTIVDNSEIIVKCYPGVEPISLVAALVYAAVALVVSLAVSAIMYYAFPVKKPTLRQAKDENSTSWEGITTTQGPGGIVPVHYGQVKGSGQLLSSYFSTEGVTGGYGGIALSNIQPQLFVLLAIGEGKIYDVLENSITISNQPISNFQDVTITSYLGDPVTTLNFTEIKNTYSAGNIDLTVSSTVYTTVDDINAFVLEIEFLNGLYHIGRNGGSSPNESVFQYRYKKFGTFIYSGYTQISTVAEIHAVGHRPVRQEVAELARYDIEVSYVVASFTDQTRSQWKPYLHAVTEILYSEQSYENTALLSIKAIANENLQGALPNFQFVFQGLLVRVGSFGATPTYSDNPAWCLLDLMTNTRYGNAIPDADINLASFITFANYCDELVDIDLDNDGIADTTEKRAIMSYTLDTDKNSLDAYQEMLSGTRGVLVKTEGQWKIKVVQNDVPQQLITWANTLRDTVTLRYIRDADAVNVIEGRFLNETTNYENDVTVYPKIDDWPNVINKQSIEYKGVTRNTQILRELYYELQSRTLPKLSVEFEMSIEGLVCEVVDTFNFAYPRLTEGSSGRIADYYGANTNTLRQFILDEDFTYTVGEEYIAHIHLKTDVLVTRLLINPAITTLTSRVAVLLGSEPDLPSTPDAFESRYSIGTITETLVIPFRITTLTRVGDFNVKIAAIQHVEEVYDEYLALDDGNYPALPTYSLLNIPPPLTSLYANEVTIYDTEYVANSNPSVRVQLEWSIEAIGADPSKVYSPYGGVIIYGAPITTFGTLGTFNLGTAQLGGFNITTSQMNALVTINDTSVTTWRDAGYYAGSPAFYLVVPISTSGIPNNEGSLSVVAGSNGVNVLPGDNFAAVAISSSAITLTWDNHTDPRLQSNDLYRNTVNSYSGATFVANIVLPTETFADSGLTTLTTYYYFLIARDRNSNQGTFQAVANATTL